uniref:40S ribosomal protein S27 n=1 Tax=Rhizophora mucronata TaxID=61149 RepID=A0A2P2JV15_RHIMU
MLKQPWHFTSMKKELGDWTRRFSLCFLFSVSAGGFNTSMSFWRTILIGMKL